MMAAVWAGPIGRPEREGDAGARRRMPWRGLQNRLHGFESRRRQISLWPSVWRPSRTLAHRGVLLLDEAFQFRADTLDALRQPLEAGSVCIARVDDALQPPARFSLLTAFNPCPCGWRGSGIEGLPLRGQRGAALRGTHVRAAARSPGPVGADGGAADPHLGGRWQRTERCRGAADRGCLAPAGQPMWRGAGTAHNPKAVTSSLEALESAAVSTRDAVPSGRRARPAAPVQAQPR